jgi:hypothetical protein
MKRLYSLVVIFIGAVMANEKAPEKLSHATCGGNEFARDDANDTSPLVSGPFPCFSVIVLLDPITSEPNA